MRLPGRIRVAWENDTALKIETEAGTQTRLLQFGKPQQGSAPSWQGTSVAAWQPAGGRRGAAPNGGSLRVVTGNLRAGYLRKNGVPYSEDAVLTEHWDVHKRPNGEEYLTITTQVDDPQYLRTPRLVAPIFKKEPNGAKWDPTPCSAQW